jgi:multiple sugar transport system substrate-binding protein
LPSWSAATFYYEEAVRRLDPLIRRDGFKTDNLAPPFDVATYKRGFFALPRGQSTTWVLFCNTRLFQEAGQKLPTARWTWDDLLASARALTRPAGSASGGQNQWGISLESLADFYYPWLWGNGGEEFDRAGEASALDKKESQDALQWLADLRLKHKVAPPEGELPAGAAAFATGRLGMWYGPADAELELARLNAPDFAIAPQPKGRTGQQAGYKPDVVALSSLSQQVNDSWELLQFLVDVDTQRQEWESGLWLPQAKTIVGAEAYQKPGGAPHDRRPGIPGAQVRARTPVIFPRGDDMRAAALKELAPLWQGTRSVKDATDAAVKAVNAILNGEA